MRLTVGLALVEGVSSDVLDDDAAIRACLEAGVAAGGFTLYDLKIVRFQPQGITGAAIVGESHLTIHTWPEEGKAFIDVASCGAPEGVDHALDAMEKALPGGRMSEVEVRTLGAARP